MNPNIQDATVPEENNNLEKEPLDVLIRSKNKIYYKGKASSISSVNDDGPFDVLSAHTNFISLVKDFVIIDFDKDTRKDFKIDRGVLKVSANKVEGFIGI